MVHYIKYLAHPTIKRAEGRRKQLATLTVNIVAENDVVLKEDVVLVATLELNTKGIVTRVTQQCSWLGRLSYQSFQIPVPRGRVRAITKISVIVRPGIHDVRASTDEEKDLIWLPGSSKHPLPQILSVRAGDIRGLKDSMFRTQERHIRLSNSQLLRIFERLGLSKYRERGTILRIG